MNEEKETIETPGIPEVDTDAIEKAVQGLDANVQDADIDPKPLQPTLEDVAAELGWRPDGKKSAADYIKAEREITKHVKDELAKSRASITSITKMVKELKEQQDSSKTDEVAQKIEELKQQRREVFETGEEYEVLERIDEQIAQLSAQASKKSEEEPSVSTPLKDVDIETAWIKEHEWFADQEDARTIMAQGIYAMHQGSKSSAEILSMIDAKLAQTEAAKPPVPEKKAAAPSVGLGKSPSRRGNTPKITIRDIDQSTQTIIKEIVASGVYDSIMPKATDAQKVQYHVDQMVKSGGLENVQ